MTLPEFLSRHWEMLVGRLQGPLNFRFIMQPLVAVILAIRAGVRDTRVPRSLAGVRGAVIVMLGVFALASVIFQQ